MTEQPTMRLIVNRAPGALVRACPEGRHVEHAGLTCAEADVIVRAEQGLLTAAVDRAIRDLDRTPMADVPPALRGPNWKGQL